MKWLDIFLNQIFFLLFNFFFILLKLLSNTILFILIKFNLFFKVDFYKLAYNALGLFFTLLSVIFSFLFSKIPAIFKYLFFVSFVNLLKPLFFRLNPYVIKYPNIKKIYLFLIGLFTNIYTQLLITFWKLLYKTWKIFIDFLFFSIYKNRVYIVNNFIWVRNFFTKLLLIYVFFLNSFFLSIFTPNYLDLFTCWDLDSLFGCLLVFISFVNLDNLSLLFYTVYHTGVLNIFLLRFDDFLIFSGFSWLSIFYEFRVSLASASQQPTFLYYFFDHLISTETSCFVSFDFDSTPIFFFSGVLFFTTVILSWFFFSYLGLYGIFKLNILSLVLFLLSLLFSAKSILINQKVYIIKLCSWAFLSTNVRIDYYFLIDTISFSFMLLTTTIAFFVFIYAFSYFRYEPLVDRFLLFILSFVIGMIFLVTSGNTIMLFLGWELIGFTSFCLINFWTTKAGTLKSAFKAFTFNKVSDFFMFMFLVATFSVYYTFDILSLNNQVFKYEPLTIFFFTTPVNFNEFLAILIIGASFIKSAQLGGHAWLPDSMEAPVPASSLIHSATLVSAGVYMILRFNFIFDCTQYSKFLIPVVGSLTAAYGGVCAIAQSDIKKTLAYSTISHCGFLMVLCATEMNEFTILYLYVHGFFKAGVFMCVGNVLRITRGYQDTRRMGGLIKYLPFEYFCAVVGVLNLAGLPFTFGFFIKHLLLISLEKHIYIYYFVLFHCLVGAFSGLFYSYRLINYTFCDFKKANKVLYLNLNNTAYNSTLYSNSSVAATLAILFLFFTSYLVIYFMFRYFLASNYIFSDFMNTTVLSTYYSVLSSSSGYLLNFSYINITVLFVALALLFSKFRKIQNNYNSLRVICFIVFTLLLFLIFN